MKFRELKSFLSKIIKRAYKKAPFSGANLVNFHHLHHRHRRLKFGHILSLGNPLLPS